MRVNVFLLLLFIPFVGHPNPSWNWSESLRNTYSEIFNLQFTAAENNLNRVFQTDKENLHAHYLLSKMQFLKAFITEDEIEYKRFATQKKVLLNNLESSDDNQGFKGYYFGEVILYSAILQFKRGENMGAAMEFRKGYKALEKNSNNFPDFIPQQLPLGFLHSVIGAVPENYKWIVKLIGFKGTIKQGLLEIKTATHQIKSNPELRYLEADADMLYLLVKYFLDNDLAVSLNLIEGISKKPESPLQIFLACSFYNANGKSSFTLELIKRTQPILQNGFPMLYLYLQKGSALLYTLNRDAEKEYLYYVNNYKGHSFVKAVYQRLAWARAVSKDTSGYFAYMKMIPEKGGTFTDEDKQAEKDGLNPEFPNVYLLRARLLFDGGYYSEALRELARPIQSFSSNRDQIELVYRMARIKDKQNNFVQAVEYYERTYEIGKNKTYYFAANAALQLGLLYESNKQKTKARNWFMKCLELRNHEYQNSIDQKAEAGLNRVSF